MDFKITLINVLKHLVEKVYNVSEQMDNFGTEIETIKKMRQMK